MSLFYFHVLIFWIYHWWKSVWKKKLQIEVNLKNLLIRSSIKLDDSELLGLSIWAKLFVIAEGRSYYLTMILWSYLAKLWLEKRFIIITEVHYCQEWLLCTMHRYYVIKWFSPNQGVVTLLLSIHDGSMHKLFSDIGNVFWYF